MNRAMRVMPLALSRQGAGAAFKTLAWLVVAATLGMACGRAASAAETPASPGMALLQKMQQAARSLDYAGVYTYQQGNVVLSTRVVHVVDGTGERERISLLDGQPREYIRHNETTQCLLPDRKVVLVEQRESERFPAVLLDEGDRLPGHYDLQVSETPERVAGRVCHELRLEPLDSQRYGYRFCADKETGLPLRVQTVGPEGVLIQIVFNTLDVGADVTSEALSPTWNIKDWEVV
ncbi:MAG: siderophore-interacting protein, partial [Alcaligenaceae bacterium]|nr:siderophore-interacting protein [Alcaligenaceae bacterium]